MPIWRGSSLNLALLQNPSGHGLPAEHSVRQALSEVVVCWNIWQEVASDVRLAVDAPNICYCRFVLTIVNMRYGGHL